jgi:hypothetical protein
MGVPCRTLNPRSTASGAFARCQVTKKKWPAVRSPCMRTYSTSSPRSSNVRSKQLPSFQASKLPCTHPHAEMRFVYGVSPPEAPGSLVIHPHKNSTERILRTHLWRPCAHLTKASPGRRLEGFILSPPAAIFIMPHFIQYPRPLQPHTLHHRLFSS